MMRPFIQKAAAKIGRESMLPNLFAVSPLQNHWNVLLALLSALS